LKAEVPGVAQADLRLCFHKVLADRGEKNNHSHGTRYLPVSGKRLWQVLPHIYLTIAVTSALARPGWRAEFLQSPFRSSPIAVTGEIIPIEFVPSGAICPDEEKPEECHSNPDVLLFGTADIASYPFMIVLSLSPRPLLKPWTVAV